MQQQDMFEWLLKLFCGRRTKQPVIRRYCTNQTKTWVDTGPYQKYLQQRKPLEEALAWAPEYPENTPVYWWIHRINDNAYHATFHGYDCDEYELGVFGSFQKAVDSYHRANRYTFALFYGGTYKGIQAFKELMEQKFGAPLEPNWLFCREINKHPRSIQDSSWPIAKGLICKKLSDYLPIAEKAHEQHKRAAFNAIHEEIIAAAMHPRRMAQFVEDWCEKE